MEVSPGMDFLSKINILQIGVAAKSITRYQ
jgi:hypothetical protein